MIAKHTDTGQDKEWASRRTVRGIYIPTHRPPRLERVAPTPEVFRPILGVQHPAVVAEAPPWRLYGTTMGSTCGPSGRYVNPLVCRFLSVERASGDVTGDGSQAHCVVVGPALLLGVTDAGQDGDLTDELIQRLYGLL